MVGDLSRTAFKPPTASGGLWLTRPEGPLRVPQAPSRRSPSGRRRRKRSDDVAGAAFNRYEAIPDVTREVPSRTLGSEPDRPRQPGGLPSGFLPVGPAEAGMSGRFGRLGEPDD